jgi:hypothetical protein
MGFQPHNRSRRRALIVGGQKAVTLGNKTRTKASTGAFGEIQGIDNEHD